MIVVVGQPRFRASESGPGVDGMPARIALVASARGRPVQLVGKAGEDPEGDAVVHALALGGVGHVALLREAGRPTLRADPNDADALWAAEALEATETLTASVEADTGSDPAAAIPAAADDGATLEAADVDLALRYLTDCSVLVARRPAAADLVRVVVAGGRLGRGALVVVRPGRPSGCPTDCRRTPSCSRRLKPTRTGSSRRWSVEFAAALDDGRRARRRLPVVTRRGGWSPAAESGA